MSAQANDVATAILHIPVPWLHQPRFAQPSKGDDAPEPKVAPLVAAAIGVAVGAGIQIGAQQLRKAKPKGDKGIDLQCRLTVKEIQHIAEQVMQESEQEKGDNVLQEIIDANGSKVIPVAATAFLAGVAAGAAAARP